jgi:hypothetical protein
LYKIDCQLVEIILCPSRVARSKKCPARMARLNTIGAYGTFVGFYHYSIKTNETTIDTNGSIYYGIAELPAFGEFRFCSG